MSTPFEWVPFFEEMARKLLAYRQRQAELIKILELSGVNGLMDRNSKGNSIPLTEIDPFTFTSLAAKHSADRNFEVFQSIRSLLKISAPSPRDYSGVPSIDSRQAWLFPYKADRTNEDIPRLWDLYEEVVKKGKISEAVFEKAQEVKYAGKAKLTQAIFRANPKQYLPIDSQTVPYLARQGFPNKFTTAEEYERICFTAKERGEPLYLFSLKAWLSSKTPNDAQFQQEVLNEKDSDYKEPRGKITKPTPQQSTGIVTSRYIRNPVVSKAALKNAGYKCEIDKRHITFESRVNSVNYVEAHHLVPFSSQYDFDASLDVLANIVSLCPNCHRLLHHGKISAKKNLIERLLNNREEGLREKGIILPEKLKTLLKYYREDLTGDED